VRVGADGLRLGLRFPADLVGLGLRFRQLALAHRPHLLVRLSLQLRYRVLGSLDDRRHLPARWIGNSLAAPRRQLLDLLLNAL